MKRKWIAIKKAVAEFPRPGKVAIVGAILVTIGAGMIYLPAGFIAAGVLLLADSVTADSATTGESEK
jgi:hypothetical protein